MEGRVPQIAPLVDQVQRFCRGHVEDDHGAAAAEMLTFVGDAWPDVSEVVLTLDRDDHRDAEELALEIVRCVGEVGGILLGADRSEKLAWSRANLISELRRYVAACKEHWFCGPVGAAAPGPDKRSPEIGQWTRTVRLRRASAKDGPRGTTSVAVSPKMPPITLKGDGGVGYRNPELFQQGWPSPGRRVTRP